MVMGWSVPTLMNVQQGITRVTNTRSARTTKVRSRVLVPQGTLAQGNNAWLILITCQTKVRGTRPKAAILTIHSKIAPSCPGACLFKPVLDDRGAKRKNGNVKKLRLLETTQHVSVKTKRKCEREMKMKIRKPSKSKVQMLN